MFIILAVRNNAKCNFVFQLRKMTCRFYFDGKYCFNKPLKNKLLLKIEAKKAKYRSNYKKMAENQ